MGQKKYHLIKIQGISNLNTFYVISHNVVSPGINIHHNLLTLYREKKVEILLVENIFHRENIMTPVWLGDKMHSVKHFITIQHIYSYGFLCL